jgi:plastocyanin
VRVAPLAWAAALAATAPALAADGQLTAEPRDRYSADTVTIARGDGLVFTNHDLDRHDVTGDGQRPAFYSDLFGTAQGGPVSGVQLLLPGSYGFHCSLHPFMKGTLAVTGVGVTILTKDLASARKAIEVRAGLSPAGPVTVTVRLGSSSLAPVTRSVSEPTTVRIAVPAKVRRALKKAKRALLTVTASGGGADERATRTLR